jgi:hypothetical protein
MFSLKSAAAKKSTSFERNGKLYQLRRPITFDGILGTTCCCLGRQQQTKESGDCMSQPATL